MKGIELQLLWCERCNEVQEHLFNGQITKRTKLMCLQCGKWRVTHYNIPAAWWALNPEQKKFRKAIYQKNYYKPMADRDEENIFI